MKKELAKTIGTAARNARLAQRLTQEDAAERIRVSVEFYARIERGTSLPSILTFARIVTGLGVSADSLLGRSAIVAHPGAGGAWMPVAPTDNAEIRRILRRLRKATPAALRLVGLLLKELEPIPASNQQIKDTGVETANENSE
jgi:transcriptional regulator with XRE-family HTH domain